MSLITSTNEFMEWIATWSGSALAPVFTYLLAEDGNDLVLIKGTLHLNLVNPPLPDCRYIKAGHIQAGLVTLEGGEAGLLDFCTKLLTGAFEIDSKKVIMIAPSERTLTDIQVDVQQDGASNPVSRPTMCKLVGALHRTPLGQTLNWTLRASDVPFDSLNDIADNFWLGACTGVSTVDVIAHQGVLIDDRSVVVGDQATLVLRVWSGFQPFEAKVGYRVLSPKHVTTRGCVDAMEFTWEADKHGQIGRYQIPVSEGDRVQAYALYRGRAQHQWTFGDPTKSQNPRRALLALHDKDLSKLKIWLAGESKNASDDFEAGVSTLFWLLGFSSLWLDRKRGTSDAPDVVLACDRGFVLIECTTAGFGPEKIAKLKDRRSRVKQQLAASGLDWLPVFCSIVSTQLELDASVEKEACRAHRLAFATRETIDLLFARTDSFPDANRMFDELANGISQLGSSG